MGAATISSSSLDRFYIYIALTLAGIPPTNPLHYAVTLYSKSRANFVRRQGRGQEVDFRPACKGFRATMWLRTEIRGQIKCYE